MQRSGVCLLRALPVNHQFFLEAARQSVWREETAWAYGWWLADGCVVCTGPRARCVRLAVQRKDRDVVEKMRSLMRSEHKLIDYIQRKSDLSAVDSPMTMLSFASLPMAEDLALLGIIPRKTKVAKFTHDLLLPCNAPMSRHAVRGVFEGDGWVSYDKARKYWRVGWAGTFDVLSAIRLILSEHVVDHTSGSLILKVGSTWSLQYGGKTDTQRICNWMYGAANPHCVMNRKAALAWTAERRLPPEEGKLMTLPPLVNTRCTSDIQSHEQGPIPMQG